MKNNARQVLDTLVQELDNQTIVRFLNHRLFADENDIPCRKWSLLNQLSVFMAGTNDARGIRQWQVEERWLKSDSSAFYILVPLFIPNKSAQLSKPAEETKDKPIAFKTVPVFRVEDTEGKPLPYEQALKAFDPETLPLFEVARKLGITVQKGLHTQFYGCFNKTQKAITMNCADPHIFLHELSHAIDAELSGKNTNKIFNEIVAELSAAFLGSLYGYPPDTADVKAYIEHYTGKGHFMFYICRALKRVEEIYTFIVQTRETSAQPVAAMDLFPETLVARRKFI